MTPTIWNTFLTTSIKVVWKGSKPRSRILHHQPELASRDRETYITVEKLESTPVGILVAKVAMNRRYVLGSSIAALTWAGLNFFDLIPTIPAETRCTAMNFCSSFSQNALEG
jgi:hypothetical protein